MLIDPDLYEIVTGKRGMLQGIQACIDSKCLVSAVTLMLSAVDALAALTRPIDKESTDSTFFKDWAATYLKPETNLGCSSYDLWGARCGVTHLYGPQSKLSSWGKAKLIYYQWEAGPVVDTAKLPPESIVIEVEQLHRIVESGINEFLKVVEKDRDIREKVNGNMASLLCYKPY